MQRMSGLDASFLYFETPNQHMHVSAVIVFDPSSVPGGYSFERVKEMIAGRLHLVPPFRRKLAAVPLNLHHPVWVEDQSFDLDYHIRRIGCPSPGTEVELADLAADIAGRPLDRSRPLWEMWVVEGLQNGHVATVSKMHHCTIDGVSGANMMVHLFDLAPEPEAAPPPPEWHPERKPSDVELVGGALLARAARPLHLARMIPRTVKAATNLVQTRRRRDGPGMAAPFTAPRTPFNEPITPHRKVALTSTPLDDVKLVKNAFGTTVNDVVLAVTSGALRRYMESHGGLPSDGTMTAAVPVSVRPADDKSIGSNKVSAMFSTLATDIPDPVERLMEIHEANKGAKEEHHAIGADLLQNWAEFAAPTTFSLAARVYTRMQLVRRHPVVHSLTISNVPGPPFPLYFAGAKLVALYPLGPVFDGMALNITVLSYIDRLNWGLIACRETTPDLWTLATAIHDSLAELLKAAQER